MLRLGDRGPEVAAVRKALVSLGLLVSPTVVSAYRAPTPARAIEDDRSSAVFDRATDSAVRAFQQQRGLIVDGSVGPLTLRELTDARWTLGDRTLAFTLSAPMRGDDVTSLQTRLIELGYNVGRPDGVFGASTDACVRDFQRHRGLIDDGVFGPETLRELNRIAPLVTGGSPLYLREYQQVRQAGPRLRGKRIVIDPVHGAGDPGWVVDGVCVADLTHDIARRLEGRMAATGMETFLSRGPRDNPAPEERARRANQLGADLVLSLDVDGSTSPHACGIATFHFGSDAGATSSVGATLADLVHRELVARTHFIDCRVHHRPWDVLRLTRMPAVQIEMGYLTNAADRRRLLTDDFRNVLADGILVAVKRLYLDGRDEPHTGTFSFADLLAHEEGARRA